MNKVVNETMIAIAKVFNIKTPRAFLFSLNQKEQRNQRIKIYIEKEVYPFGVIAENSRENPLFEGMYVVKFIEKRRSSKTGNEYPYCKLIKALGSNVEEMAINLSEVSPETVKKFLNCFLFIIYLMIKA